MKFEQNELAAPFSKLNELSPALRPHIGPRGHEHLNLVGNYDFEDGQQDSSDHLRALRSVNEIEIADEDATVAYVTLSGLY